MKHKLNDQLTFEAIHPKWSYAKCDENGFVSEVAEKKVISKNATVGVYYWKHGADYVKSAEEMIKKTSGQRTIPQIFFGDYHVGGYTELRELEKSNNLKEKLK